MTYNDHGHPIITNPYKSAKNKDTDMKLSGCDHRGHLTSLKRPTLTWSNLTSPSHDLLCPWPPNYNKSL